MTPAIRRTLRQIQRVRALRNLATLPSVARISPGDVFHHGRYEALGELGWGSYSTVWLGKDKLTGSNIAMKFTLSEKAEHEFRILEHLWKSPVAQALSEHPGRQYVEEPRDIFVLRGKHNSEFSCLVFEAFGMSVADRVAQCKGDRLPASEAKSVTRQLTLGLDYVSKCGVANGDVRTENILYKSIGKTEGSSVEIKLTDFGSAFFHGDPPRDLHTWYHTRPPEVLIGWPVTKHMDSWQLGCMILEIVTGNPLIIPTPFAERADVLSEIKSILGPLPSEWTRKMDKDFIDAMAKGMKEWPLEQYVRLSYEQDPQLDDSEDEHGPVQPTEKAELELDPVELGHLQEVLSSVLVYLPEKRASPETLLRMQWFEEG